MTYQWDMPGGLLCTGGGDEGAAELTADLWGVQHKLVSRQPNNCRGLVREVTALEFTLTVEHHSSATHSDLTLTAAMLLVVFSYNRRSLLQEQHRKYKKFIDLE